MMSKFLKPAVFIACLFPLAWMIWDGFNAGLGANPIEEITHRTGDWALRFLLITLAITPARKLFNLTLLIRLRRMLGLYAFFYAVLHFLTYVVFDHFFDMAEIAQDVIKHPYVTVGFGAFVLLIPLAVTSTNKMMKRLGKRWKKLHQLVYLIGTLGVLHYLWLVKADVREPLIYGAVLVVLLVLRLPRKKIQKKLTRPQALEAAK
jgi:sulfoxide reductase heme-binding subunit YedZ